MGKLGDALRVLLDSSNLNDPGQVETVEAAIEEDEKKNPSQQKEDEPTGDEASGRTQGQAKVESGTQQKKDGK
jgi:hypothetical protein